MKRILIIVMTVFAVLALAACGGSSESSGPEATTIDVVQNDIYYGDSPTNAESPPTWTVPAGANVTANLQNNGGLEHNFAIVQAGATVPEPYNDETDRDILITDSGLVAGGETAAFEFVAPAAGEYTVICTVAGHYPSMQGRLVVTDG